MLGMDQCTVQLKQVSPKADNKHSVARDILNHLSLFLKQESDGSKREDAQSVLQNQ